MAVKVIHRRPEWFFFVAPARYGLKLEEGRVEVECKTNCNFAVVSAIKRNGVALNRANCEKMEQKIDLKK
jgi:hypothetical protein